MAVRYVDLENGNDSLDGTTFANRWKTLSKAGTDSSESDTIRVMASPAETLVGNATWTNNSRDVSLSSAVTANINTCDAAWTASANVTATANTSSVKQGTARCALAIALAFTTGLVAYAPCATPNLSAYRQISLWLMASVGSITAGMFSLRLCSDAAGAVPVHTISLPAIANINVWHPVVVDLGSAMNSSIQSVSIVANSDPGACTLYLDNIIACKDPSSADSITHNSMIGKVCNRSWVGTTAYSLNTSLRPTQPNRTGFVYKATTAGTSAGSEPTWPEELGETVTDGTVVWTCYSQEEVWYPISGINGTSIRIDGAISSTTTSNNYAYQGESETVATYKREPIINGPVVSSTAVMLSAALASGLPGAPTVFSGGWNRTDMSTQDGETWISNLIGNGYLVQLNASTRSIRFENLNVVRFGRLSTSGTSSFYTVCVFKNCQAVGCDYGWFISQGYSVVFRNVAAVNCVNAGFSVETYVDGKAMIVHGNPTTGYQSGNLRTRINYLSSKGNQTGVRSISANCDLIVSNLASASNGTVIEPAAGVLGFIRPIIAETTPFATISGSTSIWLQDHQGVKDAVWNAYTSGDIMTVTDIRHTESGLAWRFRVTNAVLYISDEQTPLRLPIAKIPCEANVTKSVTIWTRRNGTNIRGRLMLEGGQLKGIKETYVDCQPEINTWTQSSSLVFTPTESGVVELHFLVWDPVTNNQSFWIDDLSVS